MTLPSVAMTPSHHPASSSAFCRQGPFGGGASHQRGFAWDGHLATHVVSRAAASRLSPSRPQIVQPPGPPCGNPRVREGTFERGATRRADWSRIGRVVDKFALSELLIRPLGNLVADRAALEFRRWIAEGLPD